MSINKRFPFEEVGRLELPATSEPCDLTSRISDLAPPLKEVGPKLRNAVLMVEEYPLEAVSLRLFRLQCESARPELLLEEVMGQQTIGWAHLLQLLEHPEAAACLPDGTTVGCFPHIWNQTVAIRIKTNWKEGHSMGFRPIDPGWMWLPGAVFLTVFPAGHS